MTSWDSLEEHLDQNRAQKITKKYCDIVPSDRIESLNIPEVVKLIADPNRNCTLKSCGLTHYASEKS